MKVVLIGYRGTGKSTVARLVADALGCDWIDADVELQRRAGKTIAAIFADDGEAAFRDLETEVIEQLTQQDKLVLATGGGAILREENRQALRRADHVIWLDADAETIHRRLTEDQATAGQRPNLAADGGLPEIARLLLQRAPLYEQCADWRVDTQNKTPLEVAHEIVRRLRRAAGPASPEEPT